MLLGTLRQTWTLAWSSACHLRGLLLSMGGLQRHMFCIELTYSIVVQMQAAHVTWHMLPPEVLAICMM